MTSLNESYTPGPWAYTWFSDGVVENGKVACFVTDKDLNIVARTDTIANAIAISLVPEMVKLIREFVPLLSIDEEAVHEHYIELSKRAAELLRQIEEKGVEEYSSR